MYSKLVYYTLIFLATFQFSLFVAPVFARTQEYVLPYPSFMPGHPLYKFKLVLEKIQKIWQFGNFSKFSYSLRQSDKYLVEAKTLFEYNQYLLAIDALKKSDEYFMRAPLFLVLAKKEGKEVSQKALILAEAAKKHEEVLEKLSEELPPEFNWQPEKKEATLIKIKSLLEESIRLRRQVIPGVS